MTAWANLLLKSTAAAASTAWVHLISPFAGGGVCPPEYDPDAGVVMVSTVGGFVLAGGAPGAHVAPVSAAAVIAAEAGGLVLLV